AQPRSSSRGIPLGAVPPRHRRLCGWRSGRSRRRRRLRLRRAAENSPGGRAIPGPGDAARAARGSVSAGIDGAYRHAREVARASATSFYHGMRLLPASRRSGMYAVYAFARRIDDIADGSLARAEKLAALERARDDVAALDTPPADDPTLVALSDTARRFA